MDAVEPLVHSGREAVDPLVVSSIRPPKSDFISSIRPPKSVFSSLMRFALACSSLLTFVVRMRSMAPRTPMTPMPVPIMDRTIVAVAVVVSPSYHVRCPVTLGGAAFQSVGSWAPRDSGMSAGPSG